MSVSFSVKFLPVAGNAFTDKAGRSDGGSNPVKIKSSSKGSATIAKTLLILSHQDRHVIEVI